MTAAEPLEQGRRAFRDRAWREAHDLLTAADEAGGLGPEDLEALGEAAWFLGRLQTCIDARERAYAAYQERGDARSAARVALHLCGDYGLRNAGPMARGWHARAERLLEGLPECPEHGYLARRRAADALAAGDLEAALEHGRRTAEIGARLGDRNLQALGLHEQGRILVQRGDVEEGLALLDEAIVGAVSGELDPPTTATVYCNAINVCQELTDYQRASQWTEAAKRWCERLAISGFPGICRVRRAEITRLRGAWREAEQEARRAVEELRDFYVEIAAEGLYEIGEIRLRMGDLAAAEDAFRQANELGRVPQPGMAVLRLREGDAEAALASIRRALSEAAEPLARLRLLPSAVEIAVEAGDLAAAGATADELERMIETYDTGALRAAAALARGRLLLAEGDTEAARGALREAWRRWRDVDAPYEAAQARELVARTYLAEGDAEAATLELDAVRAAFERLGALPDGARVEGLLGGAGGGRPVAGRAARTFMFTDIVESTGLVEAIGDERWADLQGWHDGRLRSLFAEHGGEEVKHTGDGFFAAFPDPASAIDCAVAIQRSLDEHRRTHGFSPQVRIGLHAAEAEAREGDYRGRGVHEAARIGAVAEADQILASAGTIAGPTRFPVSAPRAVTLKGLAEPVEVVAIDWRP